MLIYRPPSGEKKGTAPPSFPSGLPVCRHHCAGFSPLSGQLFQTVVGGIQIRIYQQFTSQTTSAEILFHSRGRDPVIIRQQPVTSVRYCVDPVSFLFQQFDRFPDRSSGNTKTLSQILTG